MSVKGKHSQMLEEMKAERKGLTLRAILEYKIEQMYAKFTPKKMDIHPAQGPKELPAGARPGSGRLSDPGSAGSAPLLQLICGRSAAEG